MVSHRGFLSHAAIYGFGALAAQLASAILLPLYTHYLTPADYGLLEILERTGQIVTLLLLGNGIRMATFSFYCQAETPADRQQTFSSIAVVLWPILTIGAVAGLLIAPRLAIMLKIEEPNLVALGISVVLLQGVVTLPMALMQARVESIRFAVVSLLMAIVRMTLIIAAVTWLRLGVWGVLGASAVCFGIFGAVLTMREVARGFPRPNGAMTANIIRFAIPLLPAGLLGLALTSADRYFLLIYASSEEVGTYSLGSKLATLIPMLATMPLWKVWSAKLYQFFEKPDASRVVGRVILRLLAVHVFLGLGVCLFGVEIVQLLSPIGYESASAVIPLLTVAFTFQFASNLFEGSFWAKRQTKWKPIIMAFSAILAVVLLFILVPEFGSLGAAIAVANTLGFHTLVTFVVTQQVFFVEYDWKSVVLGLSTALGLYLTSRVLDEGVTSVFVKITMWLSWPVLLWSMGILNEEEKKWGRQQMLKCWRLARR